MELDAIPQGGQLSLTPLRICKEALGPFKFAHRKFRRPIATVRIWIKTELCALLSPSCLFKVLSLSRVSCWWSWSSAALVVARPARCLSHLSFQASSTTLSVSVAPAVHCAIVTAAASTVEGPCGPNLQTNSNISSLLFPCAWDSTGSSLLPGELF